MLPRTRTTSDTQGFDAGLHAAQRWRALRRWALLLVGLAVFVELAGLPVLRVTYVEQGGQIRSGTYLGLAGRRTIVAGELAPTCPLIALVPLERSLTSYARGGWDSLLEN